MQLGASCETGRSAREGAACHFKSNRRVRYLEKACEFRISTGGKPSTWFPPGLTHRAKPTRVSVNLLFVTFRFRQKNRSFMIQHRLLEKIRDFSIILENLPKMVPLQK